MAVYICIYLYIYPFIHTYIYTFRINLIVKSIETFVVCAVSRIKLLLNIHRAAIEIREAIQRTENKMSWPPRPSDLTESAQNVPKELDSFLQTLLTG